MGENKKAFSKKSIVRIAVTSVIIIIICAIWVMKNSGISDDVKDTATDNSEETDLDSYFELNVTEEIDMELLKSYGLPIVIDFGSDSCIPCKEMAPVLEKLNGDLKGKAIILFVDVWKYPELGQNYPVSVIPTQVLIDKEGNPYDSFDPNTPGIYKYTTKDTKEHVYTTHEGGITEDALLAILYEMGLEE